MEFWLIEDGEKTGPFQDYDVRHRIETGKLGPEIQGWHRDQDGWRALQDIEAFRSEFEKPPVEVAPSELPPPLPQLSATWGGAMLRFLSRWTDILLYQLCIFGILRIAGTNFVLASQSGWFVLLYILPLVACEAVFLSRWGTTPGKWMGGIQVATATGEKLSLMAAILRSFRVIVMGLGMVVIPLLSFLCQIFGLWFLLKKKIALWDLRERTEIRIKAIQPERVLLLFFTVAVLFVGNVTLAVSSAMEVADELPEPLRTEVKEFKEIWEKAKSS